MYTFKYGYIYKIYNSVNNKVYIGQVYNKSIQDRWNRHIKEDPNNKHSHLGRAMKKYGIDKFNICQLQECFSIKEINEAEKYWIKKYNSIRNGYNLTEGGEGGNTYIAKSKEEMDIIKQKLSKANSGSKNGMSKQIKVLDMKTNKIYHFETLQKTLDFLGIKNKGIVTSRCIHKCNWAWKHYNFAYEEDEFQSLIDKPSRPHKYKIYKCKLLNKITGIIKEYKSQYSAHRYTDLKVGQLENKTYKIIKIKE